MTAISTNDLLHRLDDPNLTVVDIRSLAAYNGWRFRGEPRGGHIPGAVAFPAAWLGTVDDAEIHRLLAAKQVTADRDVVVYGDGPDDATGFAGALATLGVEGALVYDAGFPAWAADASRPLERLPRYESLVHIPWLRDVLGGRSPEAPPNDELPPVPRQFRGPRGIRRGPHPGRALPRHELAGGSGRLEPPVTRGHRSSPSERLASRTTRRSSCTAVTRRAMPTRSGPVVEPARSRRRAP